MRKGNVIYHLINAAIFIILEIAALNMLRNNGELQNIWISKGSHAFMGTVWGFTQQVKDYFSLAKVNDDLAKENFELRVRLAQYEQAVADARESSFSAAVDIAGNYPIEKEIWINTERICTLAWLGGNNNNPIRN